MATTYDLKTNVGKVRLLIGDRDVAQALYDDDELSAFIEMATDGNVYLASADALDAMATNEAMVQKAITIMDLTTNGPATAKALREHAAELRSRVAGEEVVIDIASMAVNSSSALNIYMKDVFR